MGQSTQELTKGDGLCKLCVKHFFKEKAFKWHEKTCKNSNAEDSPKTQVPEQKPEQGSHNDCEICGERFTSNDKLGSIQKVNDHKEKFHPVDIAQYREKINCEDCDFTASNENMLKKHERDFHKIWDVSKSISPPPKRNKEDKKNSPYKRDCGRSM